MAVLARRVQRRPAVLGRLVLGRPRLVEVPHQVEVAVLGRDKERGPPVFVSVLSLRPGLRHPLCAVEVPVPRRQEERGLPLRVAAVLLALEVEQEGDNVSEPTAAGNVERVVLVEEFAREPVDVRSPRFDVPAVGVSAKCQRTDCGAVQNNGSRRVLETVDCTYRLQEVRSP